LTIADESTYVRRWALALVTSQAREYERGSILPTRQDKRLGELVELT
jgi:hypothetical protein